jgi:hypothetical protein
VVGVDGAAAGQTMDRYREGFKAKPSSNVYNLNAGTIGGSGD